jgi:putative heme iron utilization protein
MDEAAARLLGALIRIRSVASLATLHEGAPFASMIPYAVWCDAAAGRLCLVAHVSRLSAHTRDMLESPRVCLLVTAEEGAAAADGGPAIPPQALPRVSMPAVATFIDREHPDHEACKRAYLDRFPFAAEWFALGDFSLVAFEPSSSRFIAGFARAMTVSPEQLRAAVCVASTAGS